MSALDPRHVNEPCRAADQRAAGKGQFGNGLVAAFVDRACAVGNTSPTFNFGSDRRVGFPALHFLERGNIRIGIVQRNDEAERDLIVLLVVEEPSSPGLVEWPPLGMDHSSRLMF